eukprot:TRINITY_DN14126_c0_g1_i1.p2 TRINITY_DN14126_c0_g1~~TRINITY_DN14126_c0_g1_i1.p2  ORF type:complete len:108 (-),score=7.45 TRINITY_DN14126_c0_g1_i1:490-813(-)
MLAEATLNLVRLVFVQMLKDTCLEAIKLTELLHSVMPLRQWCSCLLRKQKRGPPLPSFTFVLISADILMPNYVLAVWKASLVKANWILQRFERRYSSGPRGRISGLA